MVARVVSVALVAVLCAAVLAACGGSSSASGKGIGAKAPEQILAQSINAMDRLRTVHVIGTGTIGGTPGARVDLRLVTGKGGEGLVSQGAAGTLRVVTIGTTAYFEGNRAFWQAHDPQLAARLSGRWLKAPASGQLGSLARLTNSRAIFSELLRNHGKLAKGGTSTVAGREAIALRDTTKSGTAYISTTGKPYLLEVLNSAKHQKLTFADFNQPVSLSPPRGAVSLSGLSG